MFAWRGPGATGALRGRGKEEHPSLTTVICTLNMLRFCVVVTRFLIYCLKKGRYFLVLFLGGGGGRGSGCFPGGSSAGELQCHRAGSWESRGEGSALESDVSRSFSRVEGEPLEKSLCAVGVSAAAC